MDYGQKWKSIKRAGASIQPFNGRDPVRDGISSLNDSESRTSPEDTGGSGSLPSEFNADKPRMTLIIPEACREGWDDCEHVKYPEKREQNPV